MTRKAAPRWGSDKRISKAASDGAVAKDHVVKSNVVL